MSRLIDADAMIEWYKASFPFDHSEVRFSINDIESNMWNIPTVNQWSPFKTRPLTEEEKEDHPEWDCILDCRLPDDGQAILVSINVRGHEKVQYDEFFTDDGSYLDSGYEIGTEAIAWMPLPNPYCSMGENYGFPSKEEADLWMNSKPVGKEEI